MEKKYNKYFRATLVLICFFILNLFSTNAQNGPVCDTYKSVSTSSGLGHSGVHGVYASGSTVYAATLGGLSTSTNGGLNFTNKTTTNGLGNNWVRGVYASGSTVYAATSGGLSILNAESIPACTNGNETVSGIGGPGKGTGADHYGVAISGYTLIRCICQSLQASFLRCAMVRSNHI